MNEHEKERERKRRMMRRFVVKIEESAFGKQNEHRKLRHRQKDFGQGESFIVVLENIYSLHYLCQISKEKRRVSHGITHLVCHTMYSFVRLRYQVSCFLDPLVPDPSEFTLCNSPSLPLFHVSLCFYVPFTLYNYGILYNDV